MAGKSTNGAVVAPEHGDRDITVKIKRALDHVDADAGRRMRTLKEKTEDATRRAKAPAGAGTPGSESGNGG